MGLPISLFIYVNTLLILFINAILSHLCTGLFIIFRVFLLLKGVIVQIKSLLIHDLTLAEDILDVLQTMKDSL